MKAATQPQPTYSLITGAAQRLGTVHFAESADGLARFLWFALGKPEMDEQDWRQFEITPENAQRMVDEGNAEIARGEEIWVNYGHDRFGPRAADVVRFERGADGGVYGVVRWNEKAKASIRMTPAEWKYFSPEFYAADVVDDDGMSVLDQGRVLMQPFHVSGGGLTNNPAMKKLAVVASSTRGEPGSGRSHTPAPVGSTPTPGTTSQNNSPAQASRKEEPMKLPQTTKALGLADGASDEVVDSAVANVVKERDELKKQLATARTDVKALVKEEMAAEREAIRTEVKAELAAEATKRTHDTRVAGLLQRAEAEGKLVADNRERLTKWANADPDSFEANLPDLKVIAAVQPALSGHAADPLSANAGVSADSAAVHAKALELQKAAAASGKTLGYSEAVIQASMKKEA